MNDKKALSILGLAQKARAVASGNFQVEEAVRSGAAKHASENAKRDTSNITFHYGVPVYEFGDRGTLGHAIGKQERVTAAILSEGLAASFAKALEE